MKGNIIKEISNLCLNREGCGPEYSMSGDFECPLLDYVGECLLAPLPKDWDIKKIALAYEENKTQIREEME